MFGSFFLFSGSPTSCPDLFSFWRCVWILYLSNGSLALCLDPLVLSRCDPALLAFGIVVWGQIFWPLFYSLEFISTHSSLTLPAREPFIHSLYWRGAHLYTLNFVPCHLHISWGCRSHPISVRHNHGTLVGLNRFLDLTWVHLWFDLVRAFGSLWNAIMANSLVHIMLQVRSLGVQKSFSSIGARQSPSKLRALWLVLVIFLSPKLRIVHHFFFVGFLIPRGIFCQNLRIFLN